MLKDFAVAKMTKYPNALGRGIFHVSVVLPVFFKMLLKLCFEFDKKKLFITWNKSEPKVVKNYCPRGI